MATGTCGSCDKMGVQVNIYTAPTNKITLWLFLEQLTTEYDVCLVGAVPPTGDSEEMSAMDTLAAITALLERTANVTRTGDTTNYTGILTVANNTVSTAASVTALDTRASTLETQTTALETKTSSLSKSGTNSTDCAGTFTVANETIVTATSVTALGTRASALEAKTAHITRGGTDGVHTDIGHATGIVRVTGGLTVGGHTVATAMSVTALDTRTSTVLASPSC